MSDDKNTPPANATVPTGGKGEDDTGQTLEDGGAAGALDDPNALDDPASVGNETGPGAGEIRETPSVDRQTAQSVQ